MKYSWPLIVPEYFLFLMYNGVEIGFCFALPDYNTVMQNGSDLRNAVVALAQRRSITRARIFQSAVLPHFDGRGWLDLLKVQLGRNMSANGVKRLESSLQVPRTESAGRQEFLLYGF